MGDVRTRADLATALYVAAAQFRAGIAGLRREAGRLDLSAAERSFRLASEHLDQALANLAVDAPDQGEQLPLPQLDSDPPPSR